jgi:hypothetical protein
MTQFIQVASWEFNRALERLSDERKPFVTHYTTETLQRCKFQCFLDRETKTAGFALSQFNEICCLFSAYPGLRLGRKALRAAVIHGGKWLTCFDGALKRFYNQQGFYAIACDSFDDQYAPSDWDYETYGRPDVLTLEIGKEATRLHVLGGDFHP